MLNPEHLFSFFTDPVLRGPTIASMLMCMATALVGVILFLRKQSLIGEALSHAAYPGIILGIIAAGAVSIAAMNEQLLTAAIITGACLSACTSLWLIGALEKLKISADASLCFVLSAFFGIGLTLVSHVQFTHTSLYRQALAYLYGQAATMNDTHILLYGAFCLLVILGVVLFEKELQTISFSPEFAKSLGMNTHLVQSLFMLLVVLAVVVGARSVGVVLISSMLIAPAVAARQYTHKFRALLILASCVGMLSGFLGNYLSLEFSHYLLKHYPKNRLTIPTGPMIVLIAAAISIISLLIAPERGWLTRLFRANRFKYQCRRENLLKALWRVPEEDTVSLQQMALNQNSSSMYLKWMLRTLLREGLIMKTLDEKYQLTQRGRLRAGQIVRLHRLWEVYLVDYLGVGAEKVHRSAEEMEHILTPELERELTLLLKNPQWDPHLQKIPSYESLQP